MARTRIVGKTLSLSVGGQEYNCDITKAELVRQDADTTDSDSVVTFCDAAAGTSATQEWHLVVTAVQSTDTAGGSNGDSLHTLIWDAADTTGGDEFAFILAPHGNAAPTAEQPHYTGTVVVAEGAYPSLGGEAGSNSFVFEYDFVVKNNTVTKDVTS